MIIEICLSIIAFMLVLLVAMLFKIFIESQKSLQILQDDLHQTSQDISALLNTLNAFVRSDLHSITNETGRLVNQFNNKIQTFSSNKTSLLSQIIKFISSTAFLIKLTKEHVSHHEK
ncbi:MAG: hypothetical protein HY069_02440 [Chlamydiia bacterium]|nr:hypothetical protein [Chlamydiia bacterium]